MKKFELQYMIDGVLDPEVVKIEGSNGVYNEMDLVFTNPEFSKYMQKWADSAEIGEKMDDEDFSLVRVA